MKAIVVLTITLVGLFLPAFPQTNEDCSKRFSDSYEPHGEIEKKYYAHGPWKDVTVRQTEMPCDSAGNKELSPIFGDGLMNQAAANLG